MLLAFDNRLYRPANANYVKIAFENSQISTEKTNKKHMNNFEKTEEFCSAYWLRKPALMHWLSKALRRVGTEVTFTLPMISPQV